jgi:hypothetical protein
MSAFRYRGPLSPTDALFHGRQSELRQLTRWCQGEVQNYGIVYGGRQNGKTSLLYRFEANLPNGVQGCRVDFQNLPSGDSAQVYAYLARQVSQALGFVMSTPPSDAPSLTDCLCDGVAQSNARLVVLLLEELGALSEPARHNLANTLRAIFTNRYSNTCRPLARLLVVLAGSIELYDLASHQVSPLNNICEKLYLTNLSRADAEDIVTTALAELDVPESQAVTLATSICARVQGHPYLTQRLGAFLEDAVNDGLPLSEALLDDGEAAILSDDPLLLHIQGALEEYHLMDAVGELLSGQRRFSRQAEDLARLELLGLAHPIDGRWVVRNPLLRQALEGWMQGKTLPDVTDAQSAKLQATVNGSGAVSQGNNNVTIGAGAIYVAGDVGGDIVTGEKTTQSQAGSSVTASKSPQGALEMARRALAILEEQAAGYTSLAIPVNLQLELEDKRRQVAELESRLKR